MRARLRSYGETSTRTRSPGRIRMRNRRIFPATWPSTSWPLSSCTRNIAFGSASTTSPSNSTFSSLATDQMVRTLVACGPLAVSPSSYSTFEPSVSVRKPSPAIPEKWTNASLPPSSGVMKPKPFSSLNHFTTPVAIQHLLTLYLYARGGAAGHCLPACSTALGGGPTPGLYQARRRPPSARGRLRAAARVGLRGGLGGRRALRRRLVEIRVEALRAAAPSL